LIVTTLSLYILYFRIIKGNTDMPIYPFGIKYLETTTNIRYKVLNLYV
jgi:hypothetical protein